MTAKRRETVIERHQRMLATVAAMTPNQRRKRLAVLAGELRDLAAEARALAEHDPVPVRAYIRVSTELFHASEAMDAAVVGYDEAKKGATANGDSD